MFHLFTHAFFKALLFLGSGSVIHSLKNEQDIRLMGGIWKKLPYTWILMLIGTLALTGFPFLSGFYSKDAIIEFAYLRGYINWLLRFWNWCIYCIINLNLFMEINV